MTILDIRKKAMELKGMTDYCDAIHRIENDLKLMSPLVERLRTCSFPLEVKIADRAFDIIFKDWNYDVACVEDVYAIYVVLTEIVHDIYNGDETERFTDEEKCNYLKWCYESKLMCLNL